jgi:hypothetical protein
MCHYPRWFFAGAPSAYMDHPLASTLQEKANLCKRNQKSKYQRHLTPVGVRTIIKEERLLGFHDSLDMVLVQSITLVNDCDGMTLVVGLPLTDKSKGSSWNAPSLLMDLLLKSIGVLIGLLVIDTLV